MPIGYFLVAGLSGTERGNLLKQCLVHLITFDGAYTNTEMCLNFGASFDINDKLNFSSENLYIFFIMLVI